MMAMMRGRRAWRRSSPLDRVAFVVAGVYVILRGVHIFVPAMPWSGFFTVIAAIAATYLFVRVLPWVRSTLLWSLRNRLIVAYVLIAVVPLVLLLGMIGLSSYLLYLQFGAHVLQDELNHRVNLTSAVADLLAESARSEAKNGEPPKPGEVEEHSAGAEMLARARKRVPGLRCEIESGRAGKPLAAGQTRLDSLVIEKDRLWIKSIVPEETAGGWVTVAATAPVSPEMLDSLSPELGPLEVITMRPATAEDEAPLELTINDRRFVPAEHVRSRKRILHRRSWWFDLPVNGNAILEGVYQDPTTGALSVSPILVSFSVRPSEMNRLLFRSLGALGGPLVLALKLVGVIFLLIEVVALLTGIVLTRTITRTVANLYEATQHIRRGDFTHRVRLERRDQLGVLGESFNAMTSSISELIEEQGKRQKLESEISIAREVQTQLFPRALPELPGVELAAICRAARTVSGDYYDFIRLSPTRLGIAVADISGKGISAALLMASLQGALRSQALSGGQPGPAELVARLNRHLYRNTTDDRYATFFYAVYDSEAHTLAYTNAGHVPPICVVGETVRKLEEGGTVVGLFDDCSYEQTIIEVAPGSLLVALSDGLTEPENVYGEEFGSGRIEAEVLRHLHLAPGPLAETLLGAVDQWAGTLEQADDMTVLVARFLFQA